MGQTVYSVAEVNRIVKSLLDGAPVLQRLAVRGELSNYKVYPSGHHYFTLKDPDGALRCVMFAGQASKLRFRPENGMKVIVTGRVSVFPRDGAYQLYCDTLTPEGAGDLAVAFEQLKARLYAEGLFDPARKKPLPPYPARIGVVTSSAGAAVHDMIRILRRRWPAAKVLLLPVRVQGAEAPPEIVGAIRYANRWNVADVLIVGRGGGSIEDLWAFNDERVARAIFDSRIPVISAVGHEPDVTISDFVADARASTPSNAAEIVVPDIVQFRRWLRDARTRMEQAENGRLYALRERLKRLSERRVLRDQRAYVQDKRMLLLHLQRRLGDLSAGTLSRTRTRFAALAAALDAMSPLKVLARGYAMVQDTSGKILRKASDASPGQVVSVTLGEGGFRATVNAPDNARRSANGAQPLSDGAGVSANGADSAERVANGAQPLSDDAGVSANAPVTDTEFSTNDAKTVADGAEFSTNGAKTVENAPKRKRGRPPKVKSDADSASGAKTNADSASEAKRDADSSSGADSGENPPKRKRGRPRKIKPDGQ